MASYNGATFEINRCESIVGTALRTKILVSGGAHPNERRAFAKPNRARETLMVQCGEDGAGLRKSGPSEYRAMSGGFV